MTTPKKFADWGPWKLDPNTENLFNHSESVAYYPIPLRRCASSAQALDFIAQVAGKTWAEDPVVISGLVHALNDVIGLQSSICGSGIDKTLSRSEISSKISEFAGYSDVGDRLGTEPR